MRLNKEICKRGIAVIILVAMVIFILLKTKNQNIVPYMQDGFENPDILQYFKQDIEDVKNLTKGDIVIKYYNIDLNDDDLDDKIVYIISPLHSGTRGDSFIILINNGKSYDSVFYVAVILWDQYKENGMEVTEMGEMYIMPEKTNGFYDIKLKDLKYKNNLLLRYEDGQYQLILE